MKNDENQDRAKYKLLPPIYPISALIVGLLIDRFIVPWPTDLLPWVGWSLIILGLAVTGWAARTFRLANENPNPRSSTTHIVRNGPFKFSRNPMYLFGGLVMMGISITLDTWWGVLKAFPGWGMIHYWVILPEEAYLEEKLGDAYQTYKKQVRRWI